MGALFIPLRSQQLATLIGVVELVLSELFRASAGCASAWNRRHKLHKRGRLHIRAAKRSAAWATVAITFALVLLMALTIALELTVSGTRQPSIATDIKLCHGTDRTTRYSQNNGPEQDEINDPKIDTYLQQTACPELVGRVPYGQDLLKMPFPTCLPKLGQVKRVYFEARHFGCGLGNVANSGDNIHCDMLPVGYANESTLAATQFIGIHAGEYSSTSALRFEPFKNRRYLSNYRIPRPLILSEVPTPNITIPCTSDRLTCYNLSRNVITDDLPGFPHSLQTSYGILVQVMLRNASICVFDAMSTNLTYVMVNQNFPGFKDRPVRYGPLVTKLQVFGDARCLFGIDYNVSRMYFDSLEKIIKWENDTTSMTDFLNKASVATVRRTPKANARLCEVRKAILGSEISTVLLIITAVYSVCVLVGTIAMFAYTTYVWKSCPAREDPLTPMWSLRHILRKQGKISDTDSDVQDVWIGVSNIDRGWGTEFDVHASASFDSTPGTSMRQRRSKGNSIR